MKKKYKRMILFFLLSGVGGLAFFWILEAFKTNLIYYVKPCELTHTHIGKNIRVGGKVVADSWNKSSKTFKLQDALREVKVVYKNPLPELFRENQEAVVEGLYDGEMLLSYKVFAKHDENYMPQEAVDKLKAIGQWRGPK